MSSKNALWCEKYRPKTIDDYVFHDNHHRLIINKILEDRAISGHLLLSGVQGTGKTTLALILINELGVDPSDVLIINASDENSVDVIRERIKSVVSTIAMGDFKVILLEEADYISLAGQAVLRKVMEDENSDTRFILTCNYENKIMPAIKSRCQTFRFKASNRDDVTELAAKILLEEQVKFSVDLLDKYVAVGYPDIRKIINLLQQNTVEGKLLPIQANKETGDYKFELLECIEKGMWNGARIAACANVSAEEWEDVYRFLYENLDKSPSFKNKDKWEAGIVIIADHLQKHALVADPEINAAAMFIRLSQI
jgi:replication factor C subunit 3/5